MIERKRLHINGIVQGVGFRPFIHKLASEYSLTGFVLNNSEGVQVEIQGASSRIQAFIEGLPHRKPAAALILESAVSDMDTIPGETGFTIRPSAPGSGMDTLISPELALCPDCRREFLNPADRRYLYPFINCTNCGPRFTIIRDIPYDRPNTSMAGFKMCPDCLQEYEDPRNRRFHAQPNACPVCGPKIWLELPGDTGRLQDDDLSLAADVIMKGGILALKGLGGFHIAVNAADENAVRRLRQRKRRDEKPFALMVPDIEYAEKLVHLDDRGRDLLLTPAAPILVADRRTMSDPCPAVAPGSRTLGVMLAYTPLHLLLFHALKEVGGTNVLVMTSANFSEEPIVMGNEEARDKLAGIVDAFVFHDREILQRTDDSVLQIVADKPRPLRRSRGYAPVPIIIKDNKFNNIPDILSVGAELKNTVAILKGNRLFLSPHIGDLNNLQAYEFFRESIRMLQLMIRSRPEFIAYDMHPSYLSTRYALESGLRPVAVQHHHAHMAAVMAEHGLQGPVIGIILDGTGFGYDRTVWGGEIFTGSFTELTREASFQPMPLPGGDAAVKEPWRLALAYLLESGITEGHALHSHPENLIIRQMIDSKLNTPYTSSCGRLFDAAAVITGGRDVIRYEAQAAVEFMHDADPACRDDYLHDLKDENPDTLIPVRRIIRFLTEDVLSGTPRPVCAAKFHNTLIAVLAQQADRLRELRGINDVVLSGGVFQNKLMLHGLANELNYQKFKVWSHEKLPANDGGISAGQAAVARQLFQKGMQAVEFQNSVQL